MQTIYRLTKAQYSGEAFSGEGAMRADGRWHRRGVRLTYASDTPAGALLEVIAHTEASSRLEHDYVLFEIAFDAEAHLLSVGPGDLPADWRTHPWPASTQEVGLYWHEEKASVLLEVPSAVVPQQRNYLINVEHPRFEELAIAGPVPFEIATRL